MSWSLFLPSAATVIILSLFLLPPNSLCADPVVLIGWEMGWIKNIDRLEGVSGLDWKTAVEGTSCSPRHENRWLIRESLLTRVSLVPMMRAVLHAAASLLCVHRQHDAERLSRDTGSQQNENLLRRRRKIKEPMTNRISSSLRAQNVCTVRPTLVRMGNDLFSFWVRLRDWCLVSV